MNKVGIVRLRVRERGSTKSLNSKNSVSKRMEACNNILSLGPRYTFFITGMSINREGMAEGAVCEIHSVRF